MTFVDCLIAFIIGSIAVTDLLLMRFLRSSYSVRFREWGQKLSFFPFAWGCLAGHFWSPWDLPQIVLSPWAIVSILVGIGIFLSLANLVLRWAFTETRWLGLFLYFPLGVLAGVMFWVA